MSKMFLKSMRREMYFSQPGCFGNFRLGQDIKNSSVTCWCETNMLEGDQDCLRCFIYTYADPFDLALAKQGVLDPNELIKELIKKHGPITKII
jgi:hypothetical protein